MRERELLATIRKRDGSVAVVRVINIALGRGERTKGRRSRKKEEREEGERIIES